MFPTTDGVEYLCMKAIHVNKFTTICAEAHLSRNKHTIHIQNDNIWQFGDSMLLFLAYDIIYNNGFPPTTYTTQLAGILEARNNTRGNTKRLTTNLYILSIELSPALLSVPFYAFRMVPIIIESLIEDSMIRLVMLPILEHVL